MKVLRICAWMAILCAPCGVIADVLQDITVPRADLCVTEGSIEDSSDHRLSVDAAKMRAYVNEIAVRDDVELRFRYLGDSSVREPLGSGVIRTQLGVKLRALDACNLLYVMWRVKPEERLVVSVKRNAQQHSSSQCGNRGYQDVKPQFSATLPLLRTTANHRLHVDIKKGNLRAFVDEKLAWMGTIPDSGRTLQGPVGVRTDNVRLDFDLIVKRSSGPLPHNRVRCQNVTGEAE